MKIALTAIIDEDSEYEVEKIERMLNADDYLLAISEIKNLLRAGWKYESFNERQLSEKEVELFEEIADKVCEILNERNIDV